ncbi:bifunctional 2-keto-4-hydroxyglutarate aldolase/2-keto-3-deoxy-6-phosphogluconate aldolase [Halobacillus sp. Nhm2S1]|uniref:bifunctional 2-keto-4-hydroxyglutarate aldolase/2-keto-3-deoxy-6-phosphogluconate aldolase n=1 Tax=Halobacillus sp. Nhm2S1 TaxID=2866716 RepID=UPI001C72DDB6|nr:bifunctional 2-keto-4-hydroxyglutarate aldolase/2-keto-3-deoxy-6-phosphogluconate aldolase [Halobacillus sp. Nhm2S1]MBX0356836.1 bifunctional 2-keto-4-hydroxyglutarate aldolase/2-keto-3-deoxy-6-phosphogluconate aldolase [Halobacillus sp. Nhm2S1]
MQKYNTLQRMIDDKLTVVVRGETVYEAMKTAEACIDGGIKTIEITFTVPGAADVIKNLADKDEALIGAGTILDAHTARIAILSGAKFIVSPAFDHETANICNLYKIPYLPGCMTVNEMTEALQSGADVIKLFPGQVYEPSFIKAVKGPLPQVDLMPTGGITLNNLPDWLSAGACMIGVGGEITRPATEGDYQGVKRNAAEFVELLKREVIA